RPRRDRPRCREEQKIAAAYLSFRAEKIVTWREEKRGVEGDNNLYLFAGRRPFAVSRLTGSFVDTVDHGVLHREGRDAGCDKPQGTLIGITRGRGYFHVGR